MSLFIILIIACIVIAVIVNEKKSSKRFYIKRIDELKNKLANANFIMEIQNERLEKSNIIEVELREQANREQVKAISILNSIEQKYGKQISLRALINESVNNNGLEFTRRNFGVFRKVFDLNGKNISNDYQIYSEVFNDLPDQLEYEHPKSLPTSINV